MFKNIQKKNLYSYILAVLSYIQCDFGLVTGAVNLCAICADTDTDSDTVKLVSFVQAASKH